MPTRDDVLSLLRRDRLTINELADQLGLARNAVVLPLQQLEALGVVRGSPRKEKRAGKPAVEYTVVPGHEDLTSMAYQPFSELLMDALAEHLSKTEIQKLMTTVGRKMADQLNVNADQDFASRLRAAMTFVDQLGAETVADVESKKTVVRSYSCPLARAVRQEPCVCGAVSTFFSEATGTKVKPQCEYGEQMVCKFVFAK